MKLTVNLGENSYPIYIENGILAKAGEYIPQCFKGKKIMVFKYRPKKDSKSLKGHRQPYTKVQIEKICV